MAASAALFVGNDTLMKLAMLDGLPPYETLCLRGCAAIVWCLAALAVTGNLRYLPMAFNRFALGRAAFETVAILLFIAALAKMPIGDLTALLQTTPLMVMVGAAIAFGEKIGWLRIGLILLGFAGALLVAQPGAASASPLAPLGLLAAVFAAVRDLVGRRIPHEVPTLVATMTTLVMVMLAAAGVMLVLEEPQMPTEGMVTKIAGAGLLLMCGHVAIFLAFRLATVAAVTPFYYSFTLAAVISGLVVFAEVPNWLAVIGMVLILTAGVGVIYADERGRQGVTS